MDIKISVIDCYIDDNKLSDTKFCKLCGIALSTLNNIRNGKKVDINSLIKVAQAIGLDLFDLLE